MQPVDHSDAFVAAWLGLILTFVSVTLSTVRVENGARYCVRILILSFGL